LLSDVASPEESVYAKRKLLVKQRRKLANQVQADVKEKQLEMGFNVTSSAVRMRSHFLVEQKRRNAVLRPTEASNPVLYEDLSGLKTWKTTL